MRYWNFAGGGSGYSVPREGRLGARFEAPAGQVTYIGWVRASTGTGRHLVGIKMPSPEGLELGAGRRMTMRMLCSAARSRRASLRFAASESTPHLPARLWFDRCVERGAWERLSALPRANPRFTRVIPHVHSAARRSHTRVLRVPK